MRSRRVICVLLFSCLAALAESQPGSNPPKKTTDVKDIKVADLAFLSGSWTGEVGDSKIEQVCSTTDPQVMLCMFRAMDNKGTQAVELYTLRNTATGVEERVRFFSPDLQAEPGDTGLTMKLASFSPDKMVFENPTGTYPKRSTLTRKGNDEFNSHIELVDPQGKASAIDAHWVRVK